MVMTKTVTALTRQQNIEDLGQKIIDKIGSYFR